MTLKPLSLILTFTYHGETFELHSDGDGHFNVHQRGECVAAFDAADKLRDLAVEALNADV